MASEPFTQIDITRGTTRVVRAVFTHADGTPADLTGATVFYVGTTQTAPVDDSAAEITPAHVTSHSDPTNGTTLITLTATDTDVAPATYNVGIQAVLADAVTVLERTGEVTILQDYAKATS